MAYNIMTSPIPPVFVPTDVSLSQFLTKYNPGNTPDDKVIFEELDNVQKTFTYRGIRTAAAQGAAGFQKVLGLRPGDVAVILAKNSLDWIHLCHSIMWAGGVAAGINPVATSHELVHYFEVCQAKYIFVDPDVVKTVHDAVKMAGNKLSVVPKVIGLTNPVESSDLVFPRDFMNSGTTPPFDLSHGDNRTTPAAVCFSSGTSGKPKGVVMSHHNLIANLLASPATDPVINSPHQREVFYAPFCHVYGLHCCITMSSNLGNFVSVMRQFDFRKYIAACARVKATILRVVPPTALALTKDPFVATLDLSTVNVILCSGAPLQGDVVELLQKMMKGVVITQGYGMSEGSCTSLVAHEANANPGSVGRLLANQTCRIVDDDYRDVAPGEQGEFLVKGPTVFMEYLRNPEETKNSFVDGWLKTGDVLRLDANGLFWLTDRKKELIKYKGNQVPPAELEDVILGHPAVVEAACCGIWDASRQTEVPMAYVKLSEDAMKQDRKQVLLDIQKFVDGRVSSYKRLRGGVHYLEVIPKNPTGKLLRRLLPARLEADALEKAKATRQAKL